jgi:probable HAF family extracellular repeat protein
MKPCIAIGKSIVACLLISASPCLAQEYDLVDLGTLEGGSRSYALSINESGIIAGWASGAQIGKHPVLWIDGVIQDLGSPPGFEVGEAVAVNDVGQVAVTGEASPQSYRGFLWEEDTWTDLGVLPGREWCIPEDIDGLGRIVGTCLYGGPVAAFIWEAGELSDLGTLSGAARAYGINEMGQVVGHCRATQPGGNGEQRAFLWEDGVMSELAPLPDRDNSQAFGLNDLGEVVGSSWNPVGPYGLGADRATSWHDGGAEIVDLGQTPGPAVCAGGGPYPDNIALAMNNHGQIVGHAQCIASGGSKAGFLWQDGVMYNLNDLIPPGFGWDLIKATDINDAGEIVGFGIAPGGGSYLRAFLLVPLATSVDEAAGTEWSRRSLKMEVSPNPFRSATRISYMLTAPGPVRVTVYDVTGRRIATLHDGTQSAGDQTLVWDAFTGGGTAPGSGVYFVRLTSREGAAVRKIIRLHP